MIMHDSLVGNVAALYVVHQPRNWYRAFGQKRYHKERADWVHSGKADCGADISRPAFVVPDSNTHQDIKRCRHCERKNK